MVFQLSAAHYEQAKSHHSHARHWANHTLPIILDEIFSKMDDDKRLIYIENLELNIPALPWEIKESRWKEIIENQIRDHTQRSNKFFEIFTQWLFYLDNGCFQRNAIFYDLRSIETYLLQQFNQLGTKEIVKLKRSLQNRESFVRFLGVHRPEFITSFIGKLLDLEEKSAIKIADLFHQNISDKAKILYSIFQHLVSADISVEKHGIINFVRHALKDERLPETDSYEHKSEKQIGEEYIDCHLAGLVLTFPYLSPFFNNIGLLEHKTFKNTESRMLAAKTLHYLATGLEDGPEEAFFFPKIIVGLEGKVWLENQGKLPDYIKNEADDLLRSMVLNWEVLKQTSIQTLRETFLQRKAKLSMEDSRYIIKVEESGVDILVGQLPWGFRNFTFEWTDKTFITEWY